MNRLLLTMVISAHTIAFIEMIMVSPAATRRRREAAILAVVVTAGRTTGGYYLNAAQAGEPPGRWWGPGAQALGLTPGQAVERVLYDAVYQQIDPRTGTRLGSPPATAPCTTITSNENRPSPRS